MKALLICIATVGLLCSCSTIEITSQHGKVDLAGTDTYAWAPHPNQKRKIHEKYEEAIVQVVDRSLAEAGLKRVSAQAKLFVRYQVLIEEGKEFQAVGSEDTTRTGNDIAVDATDWTRPADAPVAYPRKYKEGTLLIDIVDKNGKVIWWGTATSEIAKWRTTSRRVKTLRRATQKLIRRYPAK